MSSFLARPWDRAGIAAVAGLILATPSFAFAADPGTEAPPTSASPADATANPASSARGDRAEESGPSLDGAPAPLLAGEKGWQLGFFGWAELDGMYDTTQSLTDSA